MAARRGVRRVFDGAAADGQVALLRQSFPAGRDVPVSNPLPGRFDGFVGLAAASPIAFPVIPRDPLRRRTPMPAALPEQRASGGAAGLVFAQGRFSWTALALDATDRALATRSRATERRR
jgi:hypothetical protein